METDNKGKLSDEERKAKERERWHKRYADPEFREKERKRYIERYERIYKDDPEFMKTARERSKEWRSKNKLKVQEQKARYYQAHKEEIRRKNRERYYKKKQELKEEE